jgi:gliding motility associated protien GldN
MKMNFLLSRLLCILIVCSLSMDVNAQKGKGKGKKPAASSGDTWGGGGGDTWGGGDAPAATPTPTPATPAKGKKPATTAPASGGDTWGGGGGGDTWGAGGNAPAKGGAKASTSTKPSVASKPTPVAAKPKPGKPETGGKGSVTESGKPNTPTPRDGVYDKDIIKDRLILPYDNIREADVFWERRIWRVIDVREKINKPFVYPKAPFIKLLLDGAVSGDITLYSQANEDFSVALTPEEVGSIGGSVDSILVINPETFVEELKIVTNDLNPDDIKKFRIKEVWLFDEESSTMQVRILGIAPIRDKYDDAGNFLYETPMAWAYYPELRDVLARHEAFNPANDAQRNSWEDVFEMRLFSSYITKESNVHDRRIQDYKQGIQTLIEADKIHNEIFNFEHDLWVY